MVGFLLAALLSLSASAQEIGGVTLPCFAGLNDSDTAATIPSCESPDLLNVESNLGGTAILKRKGFAKSADLTVSTASVTGSHSFIDSSGNRLDIVCHDRYCAKSTNGNAFANFLSTAGGTGAVPTRWSFVDVGGKLYGGNDKRDPILQYDGTTLSYPTTMPAGSILEMTHDRMVVGDISGNPNRVHYSSAGAFTQFTTGVNPEDSFFDDIGAPGDRVRGLKYLNGNLYIFKTASITSCQLADQYNTQCGILSPNIGTTDPGSIVAAGSSIFFRAQDKNYWELSRFGLVPISKKISNLVKSQSGGLGGGENSNTQTTQADWNAGTQNPLVSWNTATINGSIFPSSVTVADNTTAAFSSGTTFTNISTTDVTNTISLTSTTRQDSWANSLTAGILAWSVTGGAYVITGPSLGVSNWLTSNGATSDLLNVINTSSVTVSSGSWKFLWYPGRTGSGGINGECAVVSPYNCFSFRFMKKDGSNYYELLANSGSGGTPLTISLNKYVATVKTTLTQTTQTAPWNTSQSFEIQRSTDGRMWVLFNSVLIGSTTADTSIAGPYTLELLASAYSVSNPNITNNFANFYSYQYSPSGTFVSREFDTAFSTPTYGQLSSTFSVIQNNEGQVVFYTQVSTSPNNDLYDTKVASSDTLRIISAAKRYIRYEADLTTFVSTKTPSISAVSLNAATTGQFVTQCIQPNSSISAWGTLSCAQTLTGAGSIVFYTTTNATCASLPSQPPVNAAGAVQFGWTAQTNNATVTTTPNTAVYIGWRSLLGSATDQAQVDSCILSWNEGTPTQPAWAAYDSVKNAIYWTTTINGAASTNRLLKYDRNLEQWFPFDIPAQAPKIINNSLYFGGASSGTWNLYGSVDSDVGSGINAYWVSKDFGSDRPFQGKSFKTISALSRNNGNGSVTGTWTLSNSQTGSYSISLATGTGITYARSNYNLPFTSPQQFMKIKLGNTNSTPFEILGLGLTWTVSPLRIEGP